MNPPIAPPRLPPSAEPRVNDHLLMRFFESRKTVVAVYQQATTMVVLGAAGKAERDVNLDATARDGIAVARRRGGGGAVTLSPGMVIIVVVAEAPTPYDNLLYFSQLHQGVRQALAECGCDHAQEAGISDLAIHGRKILGSSIYRHQRALFYQSSLLVSNDRALFARYLRPPDRAPDYRAGRGHEEFCTTLREEHGPIDMERLCDLLRRRVAERVGQWTAGVTRP